MVYVQRYIFVIFVKTLLIFDFLYLSVFNVYAREHTFGLVKRYTFMALYNCSYSGFTHLLFFTTVHIYGLVKLYTTNMTNVCKYVHIDGFEPLYSLMFGTIVHTYLTL